MAGVDDRATFMSLAAEIRVFIYAYVASNTTIRLRVPIEPYCRELSLLDPPDTKSNPSNALALLAVNRVIRAEASPFFPSTCVFDIDQRYPEDFRCSPITSPAVPVQLNSFIPPEYHLHVQSLAINMSWKSTPIQRSYLDSLPNLQHLHLYNVYCRPTYRAGLPQDGQSRKIPLTEQDAVHFLRRHHFEHKDLLALMTLPRTYDMVLKLVPAEVGALCLCWDRNGNYRTETRPLIPPSQAEVLEPSPSVEPS